MDELFTTDTPRGPGPRVVLGEAEPDGWLRFVLEGEGADIVGHATSDEELARVLRGVVPDVIVLDAGISATAALEAREQADGATIVVVWPSGVASVVAEERVDPARVVEDLGDAVRAAAARTDAPTLDDEMQEPDPDELTSPSEAESPGTATAGRRVSRLPVAVASWVVYLTFVAAVASAVPKAFDPPPAPGGMRETRHTTSPAADPGSDGAASEGLGTIGVPDGSPGDTGTMGPGRSNGNGGGGRPAVPGDQQQQGPAQGDGTSQDEPGDHDGDGGQGQGGPEDPGSQGQGGPEDPGSQGQGGPEDPGSQGQGGPEDPGSQGQGGGPPEDAGSQGRGNQGGRTGGKGRDTNTRGSQGPRPIPAPGPARIDGRRAPP